MKHSELIGGFFWLALGLLLFIWSVASYKVGSLTEPGPGFVPFVLGLLLILLASILIGQTIRSSLSSQRTPSSFSTKGWKKATYAVLIYVISIFLFEVIGYLFTPLKLIQRILLVGAACFLVFAEEIYIIIGLCAGLGTWVWSYLEKRSAATRSTSAGQDV